MAGEAALGCDGGGDAAGPGRLVTVRLRLWIRLAAISGLSPDGSAEAPEGSELRSAVAGAESSPAEWLSAAAPPGEDIDTLCCRTGSSPAAPVPSSLGRSFPAAPRSESAAGSSSFVTAAGWDLFPPSPASSR